MKTNLSNDAPLAKFTTTLRKWICSVTLEAIAAKLFFLDTHQKEDKLNDMAKLLDVVDEREMVSSLQDDATSTIVVMSTTHTTKEFLVVLKGLDMSRFLMRYSMPRK